MTEKMKDKAKEVSGPVKEIRTVRPGTASEVNGLAFETVPAYNLLKPFHPKNAGWVGYILHVDGKRTYTMDPEKAADLVNTIRPEVAIPVHYGDIVRRRGIG